MSKKETSENRRALPRFALTMAGSMLAGGAIGFVVGLSRVFGLDTGALAEGLNTLLAAITPWGIPVTSALTLGSCFLLYRSAAGKFAAASSHTESCAAKAVSFRSFAPLCT